MFNSSLFENDLEALNRAIKHTKNNFSLKIGVIVKVYDIDDEENHYGMGPEYDVMMFEQEDNEPLNVIRYKNCIAIDKMGGIGDFHEKRYRTNQIDDIKEKSSQHDGDMVLVLCIDGNAAHGIILGGVNHPARDTTLTKEAGVHMEGEYNGVNWQVNKDGELTITFKSASNIKDQKVEYQDEEAGGTFVKVDKTGSVDINDGNTENIKIDKPNKTIDLNAESDISNTTNKNFNVTAKENIDMKATKDFLLQAEGKADIIIKKNMSMEITKNLKGKAKMWDIESESIFKLKTKSMNVEGESAQIIVKSTMIQGNLFSVQTPLVTLGMNPTPALTMRTLYLGIGNVGLPVISNAIGPYSPGVFIAT